MATSFRKARSATKKFSLMSPALTLSSTLDLDLSSTSPRRPSCCQSLRTRSQQLEAMVHQVVTIQSQPTSTSEVLGALIFSKHNRSPSPGQWSTLAKIQAMPIPTISVESPLHHQFLKVHRLIAYQTGTVNLEPLMRAAHMSRCVILSTSKRVMLR